MQKASWISKKDFYQHEGLERELYVVTEIFRDAAVFTGESEKLDFVGIFTSYFVNENKPLSQNSVSACLMPSLE